MEFVGWKKSRKNWYPPKWMEWPAKSFSFFSIRFSQWNIVLIFIFIELRPLGVLSISNSTLSTKKQQYLLGPIFAFFLYRKRVTPERYTFIKYHLLVSGPLNVNKNIIWTGLCWCLTRVICYTHCFCWCVC